MKRDWDLLLKQLNDIEEGLYPLKDISDESKWPNEIEREKEKFRQLGHLKLLIDGGFLEGDIVDDFILKPRLTMSGHDLLTTLRSQELWEEIKSLAKNNGIELNTFSIKYLAGKALQILIN